MKVQPSHAVELQPVTMEGSSGCQVRWLLSSRDGAPNFAMRQFEVAPGGFTPLHHHPYEHEIYVVEGQGEVYEAGEPHTISAGDVVLISPNEVHQFKNNSDKPFKFLCLIPNSADTRPGVGQPECAAVGASDRQTPSRG